MPTALRSTSLLPSAPAMLSVLGSFFMTNGFSELFSDNLVDSR